MAGSAIDVLRKTMTEAVGVGRRVGGRAAASAGPRIVTGVEAVRSRLTGPHPKPPTAPSPEPPPAGRRPSPSPASVAGNIAQHDPAADPVIPKRKPVKRSGPGAKLPAPKRS